jgi:hypothetical protein
LRKNKEVLARNGGGKNLERNVSKPVFCGVLRTKHQYSIEKPQEKYSTP